MTEAAVTFTGDFSLKVFAMMKGIKEGGWQAVKAAAAAIPAVQA